VDENQTIFHWTTALFWGAVLEMGALDLSDDTWNDDTCAYLRDIQQLSVLQQSE
jgi:hypothetical protein